MVQPPGITLLMAPVAAATKALGTAWGMGVGRLLTAVAGGVRCRADRSAGPPAAGCSR